MHRARKRNLSAKSSGNRSFAARGTAENNLIVSGTASQSWESWQRDSSSVAILPWDFSAHASSSFRRDPLNIQQDIRSRVQERFIIGISVASGKLERITRIVFEKIQRGWSTGERVTTGRDVERGWNCRKKREKSTVDMCGMGDFISVSESFHFISSLDFLYYASTVASNTYIAERAKLISTLIRGLLIASVIYGTVRGPHISRRTFISAIPITKYSPLRFKLLTYVTLELQNILQILSSFLFKDILECVCLYIYLCIFLVGWLLFLPSFYRLPYCSLQLLLLARIRFYILVLSFYFRESFLFISIHRIFSFSLLLFYAVMLFCYCRAPIVGFLRYRLLPLLEYTLHLSRRTFVSFLPFVNLFPFFTFFLSYRTALINSNTSVIDAKVINYFPSLVQDSWQTSSC